MSKTPKHPSTDDEIQSERFLQAGRDLEAAGELNLTAEAFERAMAGVVSLRQQWFNTGEGGQENPPSTPG